VAAATVGADHNSCGKALLVCFADVSTDAADLAVGEDQVVDVELLPDGRAGMSGRVDQDRIENPASWCVRRGVTVERLGCASNDDRAEIEAVTLDRRAARCQHLIEQPPPVECGHAGGMDDMGGQGVAWELRAVDDQDPVALPRQKHRCDGACASRAHHDRVILIIHR